MKILEWMLGRTTKPTCTVDMLTAFDQRTIEGAVVDMRIHCGDRLYRITPQKDGSLRIKEIGAE